MNELLTIYIVDDEEFSARYLEEMLSGITGVKTLGYETNPELALKKLASGQIVSDVLLLDIEMGRLHGLSFAEKAKELTHIVFVTAKDMYPLQAFRLGVHDYLMKPISMDILRQSMQRMMERLNKTVKEVKPAKKLEFRFGLNHETRLVDPEEITYVEASSNYVLINSEKGLLVKVVRKMEEINELLGTDFIQVHRSFIIRFDKVIGMEKGLIKLIDGTVIPLGRSFRDEFKKRMKAYLNEGLT